MIKLINKATGLTATRAMAEKFGTAFASKKNPLMKGFGKKVLKNLNQFPVHPANQVSAKANGGVNAASMGVVKPGNNTNGVFLTATRQEKDVVNGARTEPRNVMDWKPL